MKIPRITGRSGVPDFGAVPVTLQAPPVPRGLRVLHSGWSAHLPAGEVALWAGVSRPVLLLRLVALMQGRKSERREYLLTDRAAYIASPGPDGTLELLHRVAVAADLRLGLGGRSVTFLVHRIRTENGMAEVPDGFTDIDAAAEVYDLIRQLQAHGGLPAGGG